jgi:uncharacterized OsmC-like protein
MPSVSAARVAYRAVMSLPTDPHEQAVALRALQRPLKDRYRADPATARQSSSATAHVVLDAVSAEVPQWPGVSRAGLHPATGGDGSEACSGDMLLEALAGCAAVTLRSVAAAMGLALRSATVHVVGHWDARGTLGVDREVPVGFTDIEVRIEVDSDADEAALARLVEATERYCVVAQTLRAPTPVTVTRG